VKYKDRIVGLIRVRGDRIVPHPDNWRTHPEHQRDAMRGVLADIGIGDGLKAVPLGEDRIREVLALKTAAEREAWLRAFDASGADVMLLDGHLRAEEIRDQPVPVLILDLLPAEQAEFLATFDPIGSLAAKSTEKLDAVLRQFNSTNTAVQQLVAGLAEIKTGGGALPDMGGEPPNFAPGTEDEQGRLDQKKPITCPNCGEEFTT